MMTARVVLRKAARHFGAPDETVTVSDCADESIGSTSDVSTGESLPAREGLYGLVLLSATTPRSRWVSTSVPDTARAPATTHSPGFVAEMNRVTIELDLRETHFAGRFALKDHPVRLAFSQPEPGTRRHPGEAFPAA